MYQTIKNVPVWGEPLEDAVNQAVTVAKRAEQVVLMADHHIGYAMPIGGVAAYQGQISPSGIGYDISCGNKAVLLDADAAEVRRDIKSIMDAIWTYISFGVGRKNAEEVEHALFDDDPAWEIPAVRKHKRMAREQLGTVGSGNHYVDIFVDEQDRVWIGAHFGSRGLGHRIASHYIKAGGGRAAAYCADVTDLAAVRSMVDAIAKEFREPRHPLPVEMETETVTIEPDLAPCPCCGKMESNIMLMLGGFAFLA
ncbi:MAG: hypothetical protein HC784_15300 [Hydrococcus sp. CSU_1_8]|nr:hypothetical protein [Hydrococcus sp. CSU_1_8]